MFIQFFMFIQNSLGTKKENVTLDLVPAPPKFEAFKYINNYLYTDWIVKSHQELQSMIILYRNNEVSRPDLQLSVLMA